MMAGILDLSQIFAENDRPVKLKNDLKTPRQYYDVPEAPVFTDIPDLGTLLNSDGRNSLLDLQPSQWMPATQSSQRLPSGEKNKITVSGQQVYNDKVSERGDCDDIYLGSQYPLVHKIGPSQVPMSSQRKVWNVHSEETPNERPVKVQKQANVYVAPRTAELVTGTDRRDRPLTTSVSSRNSNLPRGIQSKSSNFRSGSQYYRDLSVGNRAFSPSEEVENDSQEDLFQDPISYNAPMSVTRVPNNDPIKERKQLKQYVTPEAGKTPSDQLYTPELVAVPLEQYKMGVKLRPVTEIPENFRRIFNFAHFNIVQSKVFDDVMYTDKCLVLCSPTGSGKTAVFEMAIVRLMIRSDTNFGTNFKIVYMAPIKALCSERFSDWKAKFEPYGLRIMELTGDTDTDEFYELQNVNIILTTPEKWDSMTRKWRDNKAMMNAICLFLIDEIHILNDPSRGSVVEAVASRMKTIQAARQRSRGTTDLPALRFVAISATITNIEDLAEWLGHGKIPAVHYKMDESVRPVRLRKVVLGYYFAENKQSEFQFDISLSYKLSGVINTYSDNKPVLIFCATRKSSMQGAEILNKDVKSLYVRNSKHRLALQNMSFHLKDSKLRDLVVKGIGYHHAGMDVQDRKLIEETFAKGELPVLVATSTLAMGVNLPAHLVIIKSTMYYNMGSHQEYPDTQVLQMIGRAGRPQFDTSATAVIMTKNSTKMKYENLLNGTQLIESSLHKNLVEHLNAEIVLHTITDISVAVEWLKYTFLYIRVMKNPSYYGMPSGLSKQSIERRLQDLCMKSLNQLNYLSLIQMNEENMDVRPTESGRLMARYYISYKTAELFLAFKGEESLQEMLSIISKCQEFDDIKLRNNEKKTLNTLNKDKNRLTIRYPMTGKIKTTDMKVNCLIQATFGSLLVQDFALQQDTTRIFRAGIRVTRCLVELLSQQGLFKSMLSALLLCKSFKARLWEDSKYVSKQLDGIGPTLSTALVNAGLTSFEKLEEKDPREIELIVNRHPPFGNQVKDSITKLPKYELVIEQVMKYSVNTADIVITLQIVNRETLTNATTGHTCTLLVGDADNKIVYKQRIMDALLLKETSWSKKLEVKRAEKGPELSVHYISQDWVGLDVECSYTPNYLGGNRMTSSSNLGNQQTNRELGNLGNIAPGNKPCLHTCHNKMLCAHDCCKNGVSSKRRSTSNQQLPKPASTKQVASHLQELKNRASFLPPTPSVNKRLKLQDKENTTGLDLKRYAYTPNRYNNGGMTKGITTPNTMMGIYGQNESDLDTRCDRSPERQSVDRTRPSSSYIPGVRPRNDWQELDMYAKHRQTLEPDDGNLNDDASLPDIEASHEVYTEHNQDLEPGEQWEPVDDCTHDFGLKTDYGYVYFTSNDRSNLPLEWDGEWQQSNQNQKEHSVIHHQRPGRQDNGYSAQSYAPSDNNALQYNKSARNPNYLKQRVDTATVDTFGASYKGANRTLPYNNSVGGGISTGEECDTFYGGNIRKPLQNSTNNLNRMYRFDNQVDNAVGVSRKAFSNRDKCAQYAWSGMNDRKTDDYFQNCVNRDMSGRCIGQMKDQNALLEGPGPSNIGNNSDLLTDNDENIEDPDDFTDVCNEKAGGNPSRWTNYFSSQSSSASDDLNWKYPTRNGENKVVMETCNHSNMQNTQQQSYRKKFNEANNSARRNTNDSNKDHKYGEVLAWVSNSQNMMNEQEDKPLQFKGSYSSTNTLTRNTDHDSFSGIFDGIL